MKRSRTTDTLPPSNGPGSCPGYHPGSPDYGIGTSKSAAQKMWENGSFKLKNSEAGMTGVVKGGVIMQFCFAMGIQGSVRHLSGNRNYSERKGSQC